MGARGPKPTPTKTLKLRGSWRAKLNKAEPQPKTETPKQPEHLSAEARKEWRRIVPELRKLGLLSRIDRAALAGYCQAWGRWVEAERQIIATGGEVVKSPSGYPIQNPWLSISNKSLKQVESFIREFGLSPSSRSRVQAAPPEEKDEMGTFLSKGVS